MGNDFERIRIDEEDFYPGWEDRINSPQNAAKEFRAMHFYLKESGFELNSSTRILEIGSGTGVFAKHLTDQGYDVVAVDARPRGEEGIQVARLRVEDLPFDERDENQRFDLIVGLSVFDDTVYNQNHVKMLEEVARVLEVGGRAYFSPVHIGIAQLTESLPDSLEVLKGDMAFVILRKV